MHISNDRYFDDRQRHDLALRMIRHEARTCTIRLCTQLTDDRIRRLYKTYAAHVLSSSVRRHRGKSPRQIAFFTRNTLAQFESSLLAGIFTSFGLLESASECAGDSIAYGELFCDAYETHLQLLESATISFEHAWFLLQLLRCNTALRALRCRRCEGQFLHDRSTVFRRACPACRLKEDGTLNSATSTAKRRRRKRSFVDIAEIRTAREAALADRLGA